MAEMKIWVGVSQDYDSERTELFQDRKSAMTWLLRKWHEERKDAARTHEFWSKEKGETDPDVPDVTDISGWEEDGFRQFRVEHGARYFIQERKVLSLTEEPNHE